MNNTTKIVIITLIAVIGIVIGISSAGYGGMMDYQKGWGDSQSGWACTQGMMHGSGAWHGMMHWGSSGALCQDGANGTSGWENCRWAAYGR